MRRLPLTLLFVPAVAVADTRLDLRPPDLALLEPLYHLDRGEPWGERSQGGAFGNAGIGHGTQDDRDGLVAEGTVVAGVRMQRFAVAAASQLVATHDALVRGHHRAQLELQTFERRDDAVSGRLVLGLDVEHGRARGLAPVHLGPGTRDHGDASAQALIDLLPDKGDVVLVALVEGAASTTRWHDAPLARAMRRSAGLGISIAPDDGELPRGRADLLHARVEHADITRTISAASAPLPDLQVRTVEIVSGFDDFTLWIDHELLLAFTAQFGATWIEIDGAPGGELLAKVDLGMHAKWREGRGRREIGFALARVPTTTPDGHGVVSDWRLEMLAGTEDARFVCDVRGGISWVTNVAGDPSAHTFKRYGTHLQGFVKLGFGLEAGAYHAATYEPQLAGDPWATQRAWATEAGVLARYRSATF